VHLMSSVLVYQAPSPPTFCSQKRHFIVGPCYRRFNGDVIYSTCCSVPAFPTHIPKRTSSVPYTHVLLSLTFCSQKGRLSCILGRFLHFFFGLIYRKCYYSAYRLMSPVLAPFPIYTLAIPALSPTFVAKTDSDLHS
jgi:hypothetical protein